MDAGKVSLFHGQDFLFLFIQYAILSGRNFLEANIPNGCFDAYEVKINKDIFKHQEKVKLISQFQRFFKIFNGLIEFASFS